MYPPILLVIIVRSLGLPFRLFLHQPSIVRSTKKRTERNGALVTRSASATAASLLLTTHIHIYTRKEKKIIIMFAVNKRKYNKWYALNATNQRTAREKNDQKSNRWNQFRKFNLPNCTEITMCALWLNLTVPFGRSAPICAWPFFIWIFLVWSGFAGRRVFFSMIIVNEWEKKKKLIVKRPDTSVA